MVLYVQDDAVPRFKALANLMRWHRKYARGTVEELWENSQAAGVWEGSADDILFWAGEADADAETQARLLEALQNKRVKFISRIGDDLYTIHGNEKAIAGKEHRREVARLNAAARWNKERARAAEAAKRGDRSAGGNANGNATGMQTALPAAVPSQCLNQAKPSQAEPSQAEPIGEHYTGDGAPSDTALENLAAATYFRDLVKRRNRLARQVDGADLEAWADDIRKLREDDGLDPGAIGAAIDFALSHKHWASRIQSPAKLRAHWDEITADLLAEERRRGGGFNPQ